MATSGIVIPLIQQASISGYIVPAFITGVSATLKLQPSETTVLSGSEIGTTGYYKFNDVPDGVWKLYGDGTVNTNWSSDNGRYIGDDDVSTYVHMTGNESISGNKTLVGNTNVNAQLISHYPMVNTSSLYYTDPDTYLTNQSLPHKLYLDTRFATTGSIPSVTGFVTIDTEQTITALKEFSEGLVIDVDDALQFQINNLTTSILALRVYEEALKTRFVFAPSSEVSLSELMIPTNASKYILGNPDINDYVWKKWVLDNFQTITNPYNSNTIIVDDSATGNSEGKVYTTVTGALSYIASTRNPGSTNIFSLDIYQPKTTNGYIEDVTWPDYVNGFGRGLVLIAGQLSRTGSATGITAHIENLHFKTSNSAHDVDRFDTANCVFQQTADGDVVTTDSILRNSGLYALNVQSNGGNKFINCFGNYDLILTGTDKDYGYKFISGDTY